MAIYKRMVSVSNGNPIYVSDVVGASDSAFSLAHVFPFAGDSYVSDITISYTFLGCSFKTGVIVIPVTGGVTLGGKIFGADTELTVNTGQYLYAVAEYDTSEPRSNTAGETYYQNILYRLEVANTFISGSITDVSQPLGRWMLINGNETAGWNAGTFQEEYIARSQVLDWGSIPSIPTGSVTSLMLASNSVTSTKIAGGAVGPNQLASNSVTSTKIANSSVTIPKLGSTVLFPQLFNYSSTNAIASGTELAISKNDFRVDYTSNTITPPVYEYKGTVTGTASVQVSIDATSGLPFYRCFVAFITSSATLNLTVYSAFSTADPAQCNRTSRPIQVSSTQRIRVLEFVYVGCGWALVGA